MLGKMKKLLGPNTRRFLRSRISQPLRVLVPPKVIVLKSAPGSWVERNLKPGAFVQRPDAATRRIERLITETERMGPMPLWEGYAGLRNYATMVSSGAVRSAGEVSTTARVGKFFKWLTIRRRPALILEFGTAFGASGMYWLAGLEANGHGRLLTFEANAAWARHAHRNLGSIGSRFTLTTGTFEDNLAVVDAAGTGVDLAFIDAIHTGEFVFRQLDLVLSRAAKGAMIAFDDINFSDDMKACWDRIAGDARYAAAFEVGGVGFVELMA